MPDYIKKLWNGSTRGFSPLDFWGVEHTGRKDKNGFNIYKFDDEVIRIYKKAFDLSPFSAHSSIRSLRRK